MAVGDDNVIWGPPVATTAELASAVLRAGEMVYESGVHNVRIGDGVTLGGLIIGANGDGNGGAGGPTFKIIAVTGADAANWPNADSTADTLTLTGIRGIAITPNASTDTITFGLPHGGAIGNVITWTGETYVPAEPASATYEPQEGFANNNLLVETAERKFWDGRIELYTYLSPDNPPSTVTVNEYECPSFSTSASNFMRSYPARVPNCTFQRVYLGMRLKTTATSGDIVASAKLDKITDISATPTYSDAVLVAVTVPSDATDFYVEIDLGPAPDDLVAGDYFRCEFGRVGDDSGDNANATCTLVDAWLRLA